MTKNNNAAGVRLTLLVFTAAIFLSAALLFAVQPLVAKMVLPRLGGSPSVWSVAMVFFQAMLLLGYAYAHALTRRLPGGQSVVMHLAVMIGACLLLPLGIAAGWNRPPPTGQAFWLLGLFAASIGLPFFALSANGPLLQAWFARTDHPSAKDPYFLYAASNVGSFLALISYPFVLEPLTRLGDQIRLWSAGFFALIVLIAGCGVLVLRSRGALTIAATADAADDAPPSWRQAAVWVALAAVPSALLIAVTAHISTDVAASPLLWVIPLALYLATFVIVFQSRPIIPHAVAVWTQPVFIGLLIATLVFNWLDSIFIVMTVNILAFFFSALVCHGELARHRPAASHLTSFYMWMAAGGMIGGISAGLIAPYVFNWVAEYPLLIVAAVLCRPGIILPNSRRAALLWLAAVVVAIALIVPGQALEYELDDDIFRYAIFALLAIAAALWLRRDALELAAIAAFMLAFIQTYGDEAYQYDSVRSFFGVHKIVESDDGQYRTLMHGTTIHGAEHIRDASGKPITGRPEPLTYFSARSPMADGFRAAHAHKGGPLHIAVLGLGAGTLACYSAPTDVLHIYEIDPAVIRIASDPRLFTYLSRCAPDAKMIIGDGRLTLGDAADGAYDLIVMDAFTSDAVPVHLLTREALAIYVRKLAPGGMILMHVMNRHMELISVATGVASANGLVTRVRETTDIDDDEHYLYGSSVAAIARADADFGPLATLPDWKIQQPDPVQWVWTDDYSNIIGAMIRHYRR
jgi:hypothetical protein